jgi:anti-sigma B factor antagonist
MKVTIRDEGTASIIQLEGEMMLGYEANDFHQAINKSIDENKKKIVVDLKNVRFISSWGIGMLIHGYTTSKNREIDFVLAAVPDKVNKVFEVTKLNSVFKKHSTVEAAVAE